MFVVPSPPNVFCSRGQLHLLQPRHLLQPFDGFPGGVQQATEAVVGHKHGGEDASETGPSEDVKEIGRRGVSGPVEDLVLEAYEAASLFYVVLINMPFEMDLIQKEK